MRTAMHMLRDDDVNRYCITAAAYFTIQMESQSYLPVKSQGNVVLKKYQITC